MKRVDILLTALLLCSCSPLVKTQGTGIPTDISGIWYSGYRLSATDHTLYTCTYRREGTFGCTVFDKGCSGSLCESDSFTSGGTWQFDGTTLIRQTIVEGSKPREETMNIREALNGVLYFTNGSRWFRKRSVRDKALGVL